jgi:sulfofructose kinase
MNRKIICVGNLVHDEVFRVESLPAAGIKTGVLDYVERYGGPAATAAVAICHLGGAAAYWGRVGADPAGEAAIRIMSQHGVDCSGVAVLPEGRTLRAIVLVDDRGERSIVSDRRSLSTDPSVLPDDGLDEVDIVLVDTRWPAAAETVLDRAREAGIITVLDADGGSPQDNERLIGKADHVVFSSEGLRDFAGDGSQAELLQRCVTVPDTVFAVTRGAAGSLWLLNGEIVPVPAFRVTVVDTTGCGDVFHGAYALALAERRAPLAAARFASAAAALKAQHGRGWDGMADRHAVEMLLAEGETR